jgi:hypothetical protein
VMPTGRKFEPASATTTCSPRWEASGLWRLVRHRCFTVEQIRQLIRVSPGDAKELRETFGKLVATRAVIYRRLVLAHFDALAGKENGAQKKERAA